MAIASALLLKRWRWLGIFAGFTLLIFGGTFIDGTAPVQGHGSFLPQYLLLITNPINCEFLLGIVGAWLYLRMSPAIVWWEKTLMVAGVVFFIYCYYEPFQILPFGADSHIATFTLPVFVFFLAGLKFEKIYSSRLPGWLMFSGKISYSVYLLHMAVMFSVIFIFKKFFGDDYFNEFAHRFDLLSITLLITFLISYISWRFVEERFSGYLRNYLLKHLKL